MAEPLTTDELPCACGCGSLVGPDGRGRPRRFVHGHNGRGIPLSDEHREKISESHRGVPLSDEHRKALRTPRPSIQQDGAYQWRGENASYSAIHMWLDRYFGHEKIECEECEATSTRLQWAFRGCNGGFSRRREEYRILCPSCHRRFDLAKERHG
jgi:hypothetical protein